MNIIMNWKIILKPLGIAILSIIIPFIFVWFFIGCMSGTGVFDSCGYRDKINTIWVIFVFFVSFISSLVLLGIEKGK